MEEAITRIFVKDMIIARNLEVLNTDFAMLSQKPYKALQCYLKHLLLEGVQRLIGLSF